MKTPEVFISYSHEDASYKDVLLRHLRILEKNHIAMFWDTSEIPSGSDWSKSISSAIDKAAVAILLVSPHFMASDFINNVELPALIKRAQTHGTIILPILIRSCAWTSFPQLAQFQFMNDVRKPLASADKPDEEFAIVALRIAELLMAGKARLLQPPDHPEAQGSETPPAKEGGHVFLSHSKHDGDFAELTKLRLEKEGFSAWIDNDRLEPGVDWRQEIDDSIKASRALVAIMSPEARESEYVTYEWAYAWGREVPLIPLMLVETPLHPRLAALQYLDFTNRRARPWDKLFATIRKVKRIG